MTDTEILNWLEKNCGYMEHGDTRDRSGYWPHRETDCEPKMEFVGLTLREYVELRAATE